MVTIFFLCFTNSLNITFFILLLVLLQPLFKKYLSAVCLYRLWVVLLIGLLIPMRFDTSKALFYISSPRISVENNASGDRGMQDSNEFYNATTKNTLSQKQLTIDAKNTNNSSNQIWAYFFKFLQSVGTNHIVHNRYLFLSQVWILGAIFLLAVKGIQYGKYMKRLKRFMMSINQEDVKENYNLCIQELHWNYKIGQPQYSKISIYKCSIITSPMTIGIIKPIILFPEGSYSNKELYFVLKHELIHIRRRDSLVKLVRLIVLALNWYNPFCYVLSRYMDHWCESSCDELVICNSTKSECLDYSKLLLKYAAVNKITTNTFNMIGGKDNMKYRLHSIMEHRKKHSSKVLVVLLLCIVFTTVIVSTITNTDVSASSDNITTEEPLVQLEEKGNVIADNAMVAPTAAEQCKAVVEYAIQAEGTPFLWGGDDLNIGVDSSGFTQAIYKKVGYDLPRTSREQASTCEEVLMESLKEGDLIFYASSDNEVNHVGIYIGEDKIIHAKNAKVGVVIEDINYRTPLSAGRIFAD